MNVFVSSGKKLVSAFVAVLMLVLSVTSYASMEVSAVNSLKNYKVFDAQTGLEVGGYYLEANPYEDNTRGVIGEDTREADYSLDGVVKIITSEGAGTGFVIDDHTIATAAHLVFDKANGTLADSNTVVKQILIVTGSNQIERSITSAHDVHVPSKYITSSDPECSAYDYALITVSDELIDGEWKALEDYTCFNLGIMTDGIVNSKKQLVYCTVFPNRVNVEQVNFDDDPVNKFTGSGYVIPNLAPDLERRFCYDIDATNGNSGSPVYVKTTYDGVEYYTVIGIHNYTLDTDNDGFFDDESSGIRMTTDLLHFYKNNPNIEYIEGEGTEV